MAPYVRTVKTASGATAVQIVYSSHRGSRDIEHIGSTHDDEEVEVLRAVARQRMTAGQGVLELGVGDPGASGAPQDPLPITSSRMTALSDALEVGYATLGLGAATGADAVFKALVLARIIEPTSKLDALRVLGEVGVAAPSYATLKRRLPVFATTAFRARLAKACACHARIGPSSLVLFDVSTLYFETDTGDGFREPGFSKERRLEPQITIGLPDASGLPLMVNAFEGNRAETATMLPVIRAFMTAHRLQDVTVVADAGMISAGNQRAIEAEGLSFILGAKIPTVPYVIAQWHRDHPDQDVSDGLILTQPWPAGPTDHRRDQVIYYQYAHDRARRTLNGIDVQVGKAERAVAGKMPVKRNRFIRLAGGSRTVNRELEAKARMLAGWKGYSTNLTSADAQFVISSYRRLFQIEKSFRMSKHDLQARPIYHHKRESIEAHLSIVFAALAVSRWLEATTGWSIKKFVQTARRYHTIEIQVGAKTMTAAQPLPQDLRRAIDNIHGRRPMH